VGSRQKPHLQKGGESEEKRDGVVFEETGYYHTSGQSFRDMEGKGNNQGLGSAKPQEEILEKKIIVALLNI